MSEIEKEAVWFPVICHLVAWEFTSGHSTFYKFINIVQLYKGDCTILWIR